MNQLALSHWKIPTTNTQLQTQRTNTDKWSDRIAKIMQCLGLQFKWHVNQSSFTKLVIAWNKHEWTSESIWMNMNMKRCQFTQFFQVQVHRCLSTLLSGLFVGQKWQIRHCEWSNHLSITLPAKGQPSQWCCTVSQHFCNAAQSVRFRQTVSFSNVMTWRHFVEYS